MIPEIERVVKYTAAKTEAEERKRLREKRNGCPSALVILVGIILICGVAARWNWAPRGTDYLVGTATTQLPSEIVAGTSPQGELGGTWGSPTVDSGIHDDEYVELGDSFSGAVTGAYNATSLTTSAAVGDTAFTDLTAGDTYTNYGVASDDTIDELFAAIDTSWPAGSGAPTDVDYLVGTADAGLSAEIVVGTSPQGELGGTWGSPTVDDTALDDQYIEQDGSSGMTGTFDFGDADHVELPNSATYSPGTTAGRIGLDDTITSYDGLWRYYDGATEMVIVAMPAADLTTTDNDVVAYASGKSGFNMEAQAGGGGLTRQTVESGGDVTPTDRDTYTDFSASAGNFYWVDIPYCNTLETTSDGNCVANLPGSPSPGDQIGLGISVEATSAGATFAVAPGFCLEVNPGTVDINDASYAEKTVTGGEKWSLWLAGESIVLTYVNATIGWSVEDNRIPMTAQGEKTSDTTGNDWPNTTYHEIMYDVLNWDVGGIADNADDMFDIKRSGVYSLVGSCLSVENVSDGHRTFMRAYDGTNGPRAGFIQAAGSGNKISIVGTTTITTVAGRQARMDVYQESGAAIDFQGVTTGATMQTITEQL